MAIITGSGLIRKIRIGSATPTTAAPVFRSMAARPGRRKTTSRPRSFITSRPTMRFPITFTARNRTTRMSASRAGARGRNHGAETGSSPAAASAALSCPIRATGTSFIPTTRATSPATTRTRKESQDVSVWPIDNSGHGAIDLVHRFQWVSPLLLSPHNPDVDLHRGRMRFQIDRSRQELDADQQRSDAKRQDRNNNQVAVRSPTTSPAWNITTRFSRWPNRRRNRERSGPEPMTAWSTSRPMTAKTGRTLRQRCRSGARYRSSMPSPHDADHGLRRGRSAPAR